MSDDTALKIDSESMRAIVQKAILDSITPEQRNLVIGDAVAYLVARKERPKDRYDSYNSPTKYDPSPLEVAFRQAVEEISHEVVREFLKEQDVRARVKDALMAQIDKLVAGGADEDHYQGWLSYTLSQAFSEQVRIQIENKKER